MGKTHPELSGELREWLAQQKIFFVATAPLSKDGHVNCSPKGADTFRVLGDREVAYLDLTGSGIETIAHIRENGRLVIMFCAFEGPPRILRLHGRGEVVLPGDRDFTALLQRFPEYPGARAILRMTVTRISDSCGYSVPRFDHVGHRDALDRWADKKGVEGLADYRREKNRVSIDGIPGYPTEGIGESQ
ncbi:MAG: pyridoxamine 5'-phosphate oxidase family protein [Limisphaerales bacterium]